MAAWPTGLIRVLKALGGFDETGEAILVDPYDFSGGSITGITTVPVGAVIAWHKSFANTPALLAEWVQCDGQTLSDGDSVYDGQVIPDLNGNARFIRGSATSGTEQAEAFKSHAHGSSAKASDGGDRVGTGGFVVAIRGTATGSAGGAETRPINISMVWIMRIK